MRYSQAYRPTPGRVIHRAPNSQELKRIIARAHGAMPEDVDFTDELVRVRGVLIKGLGVRPVRTGWDCIEI